MAIYKATEERPHTAIQCWSFDRNESVAMSKSNNNLHGSVSASITDKSLAAGAGVFTPGGSGISGDLHQQFGVGGAASVRGQIGLINDSNHQATAWAEHQRTLNKNFKPVGPPTNSAGINYQNSNGAGAFVSGSHTPGFPAVGTVGGNVPLISGNGGNTNLSAMGQSSFARGMKPNNSVGLSFNHKF